MFSWSKNNNNSSNGNGTYAYPGMRNSANAPSTQTASVVEGSIRPPAGGYSRQQHLDSFLHDDTLKRSTRQVSADDTTFDTVFQTVNADTLILRVYLPKSGSIVPSMSLAGVHATHPWLNNRMQVIGYLPSQNMHAWQQAHISLGQAVHKVVEEFQLRPPEIIEFVDDKLRNIQAAKNSAHSKNSGSHNHHNSMTSNTSSHGRHDSASDDLAPPDYSSFYQQKTPAVDLPPLPRKFDKLKELSKDELQVLLDDELDLKAWVHRNVDYMDTIRTLSRNQLVENEKLAYENLTKRDALEQLAEEVTSLQVRLEAKVEQFKEFEREQDELCAPPDMRAVMKELQYLKKEAFRDSENIAEAWLDDGGSVDDFLKDFLPTRQLHHSRAGQMELLERR